MPFRALARQDIHPLWSTALIYAASTGVMIYLCRKEWREMTARPLLLVLAAAAGLTNACFNTAVATGDVVRVILLFYLMPVWAILLARFMLQEHLTPASLLKVALGLGGAGVVLGIGVSQAQTPFSGSDVLAVAGGFLFALNNVLLRRLHPMPGKLATFAMVSGACVTGLLVAPVWTLSTGANWPDLGQAGVWPTLMLWSLLFMLANASLQYGASRLPAAVTSVLMLSEILFGSVSAWAMGEASLGMRELAGGALIALAALIPVRQSPSSER